MRRGRRTIGCGVTLINKEASEVEVAIGGAPGAGDLGVLRLTAPSLESRDGVLLGGAAVEADGAWKPDRGAGQTGERTFTGGLPGASAAVVGWVSPGGMSSLVLFEAKSVTAGDRYFFSVSRMKSMRYCFQMAAWVWVPWPRVWSVMGRRMKRAWGICFARRSAMPSSGGLMKSSAEFM